METVNNISAVLPTGPGGTEILHALTTSVRSALECDSCTIYFPKQVNEDTKLVPWSVKSDRHIQHPQRQFRAREGLVGWVFEHGTPVMVSDATKDSRYAPPTTCSHVPRSMLAVPIKSRSHVIGVICADKYAEAWFSERELRLLEAIAVQASGAVEREASLQLLHEIGRRIASLQDIDLILREIVHGAIELSHATTGVIYLLSEGAEAIRASFHPPGFNHPLPRLVLENAITRQIIATGQVINIPDVQQNDKVNPLLRAQFASIIGVPINFANRTIGVLYLNDKSPRDFADTESSTLELLSDQAAIALGTSLLSEERKLRLQETCRLLEEQHHTAEVQSRLIALMSQASPVDSRDTLAQRFASEIQAWPGILKAAILEPTPSGDYRPEDCDFLDPRDLAAAGRQNLRRAAEPFDIPNGVHFIPVRIEDELPAFIVTALDPTRLAQTRPWLQMAELVMNYSVDIARLIAEAQRLRSESEHRMSHALVGTVSRLYAHEALNAVKAIESWIDNSRRGIPNLDGLAKRVEQLRENVTSLLQATDLSRRKLMACTFSTELAKALTSLNIVHLRKLDGCELRLELAPGNSRRTLLDPNSLVPVLNNLVLNSVEQYSLQGKKGPVVIKQVETRIANSNYVGFEVLDYAAGIPKENWKHVFSAGWTTKAQGQGLGLSIVQKLVESSDGKILLESIHGAFAKFTVLYPVIAE